MQTILFLCVFKIPVLRQHNAFGSWQLLIFPFIFLFSACSTEEIDPVSIESGKDFFPVEIGGFRIYRVDTTTYTFAGEVENGSYYWRELISDTLYRQEGSLVYRLELSRSASPNGPWGVDSVWTLRKDEDKVLKTENNRTYVKLRFPLKEGSSWDGNQFNIFQDSNSIFRYTVRNLGQTGEVAGLFRPSATIIQKIDSNCINKSVFFETYFKGIGLGKKQSSFIQYDVSGSDACSNPIRKIQIGYDKVYTLVSFGKL